MRIKEINYIPKTFKNLENIDECIKYGIFVSDKLIGLILRIDFEIGFIIKNNYRNKGYMSKALKRFIKKNHHFTVLKTNIYSNKLLKKLCVKYKSDNLFNYYIK